MRCARRSARRTTSVTSSATSPFEATVTVLDAFAVVALMRDERAAEMVAEIVRSPTTLTAVNAAEVIDRLVRRYGRDADDVEMDLRLLTVGGMEMVAVTVERGLEAGRLRTQHYDRNGSSVSLADCVAAATALRQDVPIATADRALAAMVRAEGGEVTGLPDSTGRMP